MKIIKKIQNKLKKKEIIPIEHYISGKKMFQNKVAIITGGTGGIGKSIVEQLLEEGCKVIVIGSNENKLKNLESKINDQNLFTFRFDLNKISDLKIMIDEIFNQFGNVDFLIHSAGIHTENVDFFTMIPEEFDRVMNLNLKSIYFLSQAFAKKLIASGRNGKILIISSSRGSEPAWSPYGISKWGLKGLTEGLAQLLTPHNIIVNSIAPGSTATELIGKKEGDSINTTENKIGRLIMPTEVAALVKFLLSESGNMIIGETIHISAGRGIFDIR